MSPRQSIRFMLVPLLMMSAGTAMAAGISFGREVRYPTRWEARSVATAGGGQVVLYPSEFSMRRTGTGMQVQQVGVVLYAGRQAGKPLYELRPPDGNPAFVAQEGQRVKSGDREYLPMGWNGLDYRVLDLKTRKVLVFRKPPVAKKPAEVATTTERAPLPPKPRSAASR